MDPEEFRTDYTEDALTSKANRWVAAPVDRPDGVWKREAMRLWDVTEYRLNALERAGQLVGLRVDNKVIYNRARLVQLLGEPSPDRPNPLRRHNSSTSVSGEQLSWPEIGTAAAAA
jgi:hypothetical protein